MATFAVPPCALDAGGFCSLKTAHKLQLGDETLHLATSCTKFRACDRTAMVCFGVAEVGTALVAAAPVLSAKPKMFVVICRSTTADTSLTLPCRVCKRAIKALKQA